MTERTVQDLLIQLRENTRSTLVPGSGCIPLPRLVEGLVNNTLNSEENMHLIGCRVCQRSAANVRVVQMFRADTDGHLYDVATGQALSSQEPLGFPDPSDSQELLERQPKAPPRDLARTETGFPADTRSRGNEHLGLTHLVRDPQRRPEAIERLRPWVPFLLEWVGLSPDLAGKLLAFIREQLPDLGDRRFRDALGGWLKAFARQQGHPESPQDWRPEDWRAMIAVGAAMRTLDEMDTGGVEWVNLYRRHARAQRPTSPVALRELPPPPGFVEATGLPVLRRGLEFEAQRREREGLCLFELN